MVGSMRMTAGGLPESTQHIDPHLQTGNAPHPERWIKQCGFPR
jgi:hypothetical protein